MDLEQMEEKRSVREGYVVLLRANAELLMPNVSYAVMRSFYQRIADACMSWTVEVFGERVRSHFLSLSDIREKSRFRTLQYRFRMRVPWQNDSHITLLCESERVELDGTVDFYRICHTWNIEEQTILPLGQILPLVDARFSKKELPFLPDGAFREGDCIVVYQNKMPTHPFIEAKLPINKN